MARCFYALVRTKFARNLIQEVVPSPIRDTKYLLKYRCVRTEQISAFARMSSVIMISRFQVHQGIVSGLPLTHPYFKLIADQKSLMDSFFIVSAGCSFAFFVGWGILISHKISGPLHRLTLFFEEIETPHFEKRLSFRPGDFFLEIPTAINKWMDKNHRS